MAKYGTLKELVAAKNRGELEGLTLTLDNDYVSMVKPMDEDWVDVEDIYESDPHNLVLEALQLLGIPYEYC